MRKCTIGVAVLAAIMIPLALAALGRGETSTSQPADPELTKATAMMAAVRGEIQGVERQLAKVQALEAQVAQLEQTIAVMTPLLASREKAKTGDINGDGKRDRMDLSTVYCCQGVPATQPNTPAWFADVDHDGDVDKADTIAVNAIIAGKQ